MRKGIIGDWKNYFTESQSEQFDRAILATFIGMGLKLAFDDEEARGLCYSSLDGRILSSYPRTTSSRPSTAPPGLFKSPFVAAPPIDPQLQDYRHIPDPLEEVDDDEDDDDDFEVDIRHPVPELMKPSKAKRITDVQELSAAKLTDGSKDESRKRNSDPGVPVANGAMANNNNNDTGNKRKSQEVELSYSSPRINVITDTFTEIAL